MKEFKFTREFLSNVPGMEIDLYKSGDLNGSWMTWCACLEAVAVSELVVDPYTSCQLYEHELEEILLKNNIYAYVEDERA